MPAHPLVRRLLSPAGLVLAALCFLLPFAAVSCQGGPVTITAEYTGTDLVVGGPPTVTSTGDDGLAGQPADESDDPLGAAPLAILALLAILTGIGLAALPVPGRRLRGGLAAAGTATLLLAANQITVQATLRAQIEREAGPLAAAAGDYVHSRYGFWLALLLTSGVTAYHGAELLLARRARAAGPPPPGPPPPGPPPGAPPPYAVGGHPADGQSP